MYDWVTMLYSINWHNTVNQLFINLKKKTVRDKDLVPLMESTNKDSTPGHFILSPCPMKNRYGPLAICDTSGFFRFFQKIFFLLLSFLKLQRMEKGVEKTYCLSHPQEPAWVTLPLGNI